MPYAAGLAADLKKAFDTDAEFIKGGGGIFDVKVDGTLVYSKHETGTFPDHNKLIARIRDLKPADRK